jgi:hypothetical protein
MIYLYGKVVTTQAAALCMCGMEISSSTGNISVLMVEPINELPYVDVCMIVTLSFCSENHCCHVALDLSLHEALRCHTEASRS